MAIRSQQLDLPPNYTTIIAAFETSRYILDLHDDWDEQGSPAYAKDTWSRATAFVIDNAVRLWQNAGECIGVPTILPGPNASIDIHWRTPQHELLINVPADPTMPATYYGDTLSGTVVRGSLPLSGKQTWLMMWLAE